MRISQLPQRADLTVEARANRLGIRRRIFGFQRDNFKRKLARNGQRLGPIDKARRPRPDPASEQIAPVDGLSQPGIGQRPEFWPAMIRARTALKARHILLIEHGGASLTIVSGRTFSKLNAPIFVTQLISHKYIQWVKVRNKIMLD